MELLAASDLFVTASLAILLSILVAKLVSMAMAYDPKTNNTHEPVITLQQERLTVQKAQSESRVEFIGPIQVSTNVETVQDRGREEEEGEENKVESNVVEFDAVTPEDTAVEFEVSKVGLLREEHVEEEKEEEDEEEEQQQEAEADAEAAAAEEEEQEQEQEQEAEEEEEEVIENNEESEEQRKTEEITFEAKSLKESEKPGKTEEIAVEKSGVKESEQQMKTEDIEDGKEQGKTEETTLQPFDVKERNNDDDNDNDDDDWEGIERSELEKMFMMATEFVVGGGGDGLGSGLQMELYGLHKIATQGPCRESQPMPLKLNARAKWNAWQKLGNMSPDVAMERYIDLVSDKVPGWMKDSSSAGMSENEHKGLEVSESVAPDLSTSLSHQQIIKTERELEQGSGAKGHSTPTETDVENNVKK